MAISNKIIDKLIQAARETSENAYCPYSTFPVGAAILTKSGSIYSGCNVENASFGMTICAERNAISQAVAKSQDKLQIEMVVIYTPTDEPTAPCGACRQVINEFGPEAEILCVCNSEKEIRSRLTGLLPESFGPDKIKKK